MYTTAYFEMLILVVEFSTLSLSPSGKVVYKIFNAAEMDALIKEEEANLKKPEEAAASTSKWR